MTTPNERRVFDVVNSATEWLNVREITEATGLKDGLVRGALVSLVSLDGRVIRRTAIQKAPRQSKHRTTYTNGTEQQYWTEEAKAEVAHAEAVRKAEQDEKIKRNRHFLEWRAQFKDLAEGLIVADDNKVVSYYGNPPGVARSVLAEVTVPSWAKPGWKDELISKDHSSISGLLFIYRLMLENHLIEINQANYKYEEVATDV